MTASKTMAAVKVRRSKRIAAKNEKITASYTIQQVKSVKAGKAAKTVVKKVVIGRQAYKKHPRQVEHENRQRKNNKYGLKAPTKENKKVLESHYTNVTKYPSQLVKYEYAQSFGCSEKSVINWFDERNRDKSGSRTTGGKRARADNFVSVAKPRGGKKVEVAAKVVKKNADAGKKATK